MPSKQLNFFATYNDLAQVLERFETQHQVQYTLAGLFDNDRPVSFETYKAINSLSISADGDSLRSPAYLVSDKTTKLSVEPVPQRSGGQKFAIDQSWNQDTLYLQSGGMFENEIIVPGKIGITFDVPLSRKLYNDMSKIISKEFRKLKSYHVGPEAYALMEDGMRLGLSLKASRLLDLKKGP